MLKYLHEQRADLPDRSDCLLSEPRQLPRVPCAASVAERRHLPHLWLRESHFPAKTQPLAMHEPTPPAAIHSEDWNGDGRLAYSLGQVAHGHVARCQ